MTEIPATLIGLVSVYSPSGEEQAAVEFLVARMRTLGFERAFRDPAGNAVGVLGQGPRQAVLLGHIDTVPGEIPVRVKGDVLYGRGAVDAKGPLAAFVDAVAGVGPIPGWQLVVVGAVDEERDSTGARHVAGQYTPDLAIVGEPGSWDRVGLGFQGSAMANVTVRRPVAHAAGRDESACEAAVKVWGAILSWVEHFNTGKQRLFDRMHPTLLGMASGGDGFEEWASLRVGFRLPLDLSPHACYHHLRKLVAPLELEPAGFPIPACRAEKNTALVRAFLAAIRAAGGRPRFVVKTGTADMNVVAPVWRCPTVSYGPGDSSLDHTPDEHISLGEYARAVAVLKDVLRAATPALETGDEW